MGAEKYQVLITAYNYYLQNMRDVTGLNEARDGSVPDKNALVGLQKLAAANSNTATSAYIASRIIPYFKNCRSRKLKNFRCFRIR